LLVIAVTWDRIGPLGYDDRDHRRCGRVGAAIGTIGASRSSSERVVVGTGSLLEVREH
jgi:hypothetical protein